MESGNNRKFPQPRTTPPFRVERFAVYPALNRIEFNGEEISLEPRVMHVLVCLAERPGEVVSREDLLGAVWPNTVVNEDALTRAISDLRRAFRDDPRNPGIIETIPKSGYRMIAPVEILVPETEDSSSEPGGSSPGGPDAPKRRGPTWGWVVAASAVVILAAAVWSIWEAHVRDRRPAGVFLESTPLTSEPGQETHPALSPDGTRVAYIHVTEDGTIAISVRQPCQETSVRLMEGSHYDYFPAWSPDGGRIAFLRADGETGIYSVSSLGGSPLRLFEGGVIAWGLDWSPDGRWLAFVRRTEPEAPRHLALVDPQTGETRRLTSPPERWEGDGTPAFSPDGTELAFVRSDALGMDHVRIVSIADGEEHPLERSFVSIRGLDWTSDGRELIVSGAPEGFHKLWRVSVESGRAVELKTRRDDARFPTVSRDGERLVYSERTVKGSVIRIRFDENDVAGSPEPLLVSTRKDYAAHYSRDGRQIAFISTRLGTGQIWLCGTDGDHPRQLTAFEAPFGANLCWSPDGTELALSLHTGERMAVQRASLADGRARPVTDGEHNEIVLFWSRDGRWIYFREGTVDGWRFRRMSPDGLRIEDVVPEGIQFLAESYDGMELYYVKIGDSRLWARPVGDADPATSERVLIGEGEGGWSEMRSMENGILFTRATPEGGYLGFYDFATGDRHVRYRFARNEGNGLEVSPDGRTILFDSVEIEGDLVLVENLTTALGLAR